MRASAWPIAAAVVGDSERGLALFGTF